MKKLLNKFIKALESEEDTIPSGWYTVSQISKHIKLGQYQTAEKLNEGVKKGTVQVKKFRLKNNINRFYWANLYKTN